MSEILMVLFTGTIAISTLVYVIISIKTLRAMQWSFQNERINYFLNYTLEMGKSLGEMKKENPEAIRFLDQLYSVIIELGFEKILDEIEIDSERGKEVFGKLERLFLEYGADISQVPIIELINKKIKETK